MAGFVGDPGKDFKTGDTPEIAKRLDELARHLGLTIYGISGYRTPSHSVAVGGFANDPHTKGQAIDIGVGVQTKQSASQLTDAQLASVGLYRPFPGADEINHVQLKPGLTSSLNPQKGRFIGTNVQDQGRRVDVSNLPSTIANGIVNAIWGDVAPKAAYAGLFVLMIAAGAWLAVQGLSKSTKEPA